MKKILTLMFVLIAGATPLSAQITREQADEIVLEYIQNVVTSPYLLYIHQNSPITNETTITTETEEIINIKYNSWFYYLTDFPELNTFQHRYLLVKETNGNILEIIPQNDIDSNDLFSNWECINFVTVTEIIEVPETAFAFIPLTLSGMVIPENATYQIVSWSIFDSGTTGASITDAILETEDSGTVIVTATISNGIALDTDFEQNFTISVNKVSLMGGISITGIAVFGETLVVNSDLFSEPDIPNLGELVYQWKRGDINVGTNSENYTIEQDDIGNKITVTVTAAHCEGMITSEQTSEVEKAPQTAPEIPTLLDATTTSITLNTLLGCEYRMDYGEWQNSNIFCELEPNTTYLFDARKMEMETHLASPASETVSFSTQPLGIDDYSLEIINIIPNPTTGELRIESNKGINPLVIEVFDVYGRKQKAESRKQNEILDISDLTSGVYFVKITTEKGIVTKKVIKN